MKLTLKTVRWVWVVVAVQAVFLLSWATYHENIRRSAETVLLKTRPVDPRDVIRGDYMVLNYDISRPTDVRRDPELSNDVYVVLKPEGKYHVVAEVLAKEPAEDDPRLWVRATTGRFGAADDLRLKYGIEQFFVPEGRGTPRFTTIEVEVSVSATHRLYIRRVFLDGKRFP